jgi:hypothetical protein
VKASPLYRVTEMRCNHFNRESEMLRLETEDLYVIVSRVIITYPVFFTLFDVIFL